METRSVPSNYMSDIEYSVIMNDVIKSFDCIIFSLFRGECVPQS